MFIYILHPTTHDIHIEQRAQTLFCQLKHNNFGCTPMFVQVCVSTDDKKVVTSLVSTMILIQLLTGFQHFFVLLQC